MKSSAPAQYATRAHWSLVALVALLMLPNFIWLFYGHGAIVWVCALVVPAVLLLTVFAALGNQLWLACLVLLPSVVLAPVEAFYIDAYRRPSSAEILATIFASNLRETREYLGDELLPLLACACFAILVAVLAVYWTRRARLVWHHPSRRWALTIVLATPLAAIAGVAVSSQGDFRQRLQDGVEILSPLTDAIESGYPFGIPQRLIVYRREWAAMREASARLAAFRFQAHRVEPSTGGRQVYVLVIGESSRRNHWQLFGYDRPTNPELKRIDNLVPLSDMVSAWSASLMAIPIVVTRKPAASRSVVWPEASIVRAMQEGGFDTYWISNQMPIGGFDSPVSIYAMEASHVIFLNHASWVSPGSYDGDLVAPLRNALEQSNHDIFVVLHMMGSHERYDNRYPPSFGRFHPTLAETDVKETAFVRRQNSYDNTILYTDHVLATIIDTLKERHEISALWFESDHGEDLATPTCTMSGHGNGTRYDYEIPAFVWYSDEYLSTFPDRIAALGRNADKQTMSAETFESLSDMAGLDFPGHDRSMSVFSPAWRFRPRLVNGSWQVDFDHAVLSKNCALAVPPGS
jgi:glucan phosphoethanolaminetransferase (alkaline phosphatase superfamily)